METPDFFRSRLDAMLDPRHPLVILADRMPWTTLEEALRKNRQATPVEEEPREDLLGSSVQSRGGKVSAAGRPALPLRLMIGLLYLKHAYNESDEGVCARYAESPAWQYFCGSEYFEHCAPCDPTKLVQFRKQLSEAGAEEMLAKTIEAAVSMKAVTPTDLEQVIVDTTVMEKAVAYPTDSRLLEAARHKLVKMAKQYGVALKQTFAKEGKLLRLQAGRYAHARQYKRMHKAIKRQRTIVGKLLRAVQRRSDLVAAQGEMLGRIEKLLTQGRKDKNKIYALHAPEVECISKGKARQPYEFGVKASVAVTARQGLIVGARTFPGNPYDGHTLEEQLQQTAILLQDIATAPTPKRVLVDKGYRGVNIPGVEILHPGKMRSMSPVQRKMMKRRSAVEPVIGHLKDDCRMRRSWLKGVMGDAIHAVLCAAGYNLRFLLRVITFFCAWILWRVTKMQAGIDQIKRRPHGGLMFSSCTGLRLPPGVYR